MARSRRQRDYKAEYAKRTAGTVRGSAERQRKRGHAPTRPGHTEASQRRQREETAVLRGERGLTSADRQTIKNWYISRARRMTERGADWGAPAASRSEAIAAWERDKAAWEKAGMRAFERVRDALTETDTGKLWYDYGGDVRGGDSPRNQTVVMVNFIDAMNEEYGLSLDTSLHFALLYKPKRLAAEAA